MTIRFLTPEDLHAYHALRLHALAESPAAFSSGMSDETKLPLEEFAKRPRPDGRAENGVFGVFADDQRLAGMLGFAREKREKRAHVASLWSMYVLPEFRGRGFGAALVDHAIAHAKQLGGVRQIILSVTAGNEAVAPSTGRAALCVMAWNATHCWSMGAFMMRNTWRYFWWKPPVESWTLAS